MMTIKESIDKINTELNTLVEKQSDEKFFRHTVDAIQEFLIEFEQKCMAEEKQFRENQDKL